MTFDSKSVWVLWLIALALKLSLSTFLPFAPDESYYWVWSHHLSLSYMDHPGMVAWLLWLGRFFSWIPHGERIPSLLLGHGTLLVWIFIIKNLWHDQLTWRWVSCYLAIPFLGLGSILVTPDVPVLFFFSTSFLFLMHWLKNPSIGLSLMLGTSLGLGFCSKYHIVLFPLSFLAFCLFEKPKLTRAHFRGGGFVVLFGILFCLPVLVWNFQNDWASFRFQFRHGFSGGGWKPNWTLEYLIGQFLVFSPVLWWLYLKGVRFQSLRIFFWFSAVPWIFFFYTSFKSSVEANWPILSLAPALVLALAAHQSWLSIKVQIGLYLGISLGVVSLWIYPWTESATDKLTEVHQIRKSLPAILPYQPLYGGSYQIASTLWYYSGKPTYKVQDMSRPDHYDYWLQSLPTASIFFILREKDESLPGWLLKRKAVTTLIESYGRFELVKVNQ